MFKTQFVGGAIKPWEPQSQRDLYTFAHLFLWEVHLWVFVVDNTDTQQISGKNLLDYLKDYVGKENKDSRKKDSKKKKPTQKNATLKEQCLK